MPANKSRCITLRLRKRFNPSTGVIYEPDNYRKPPGAYLLHEFLQQRIRGSEEPAVQIHEMVYHRPYLPIDVRPIAGCPPSPMSHRSRAGIILRCRIFLRDRSIHYILNQLGIIVFIWHETVWKLVVKPSATFTPQAVNNVPFPLSTLQLMDALAFISLMQRASTAWTDMFFFTDNQKFPFFWLHSTRYLDTITMV